MAFLRGQWDPPVLATIREGHCLEASPGQRSSGNFCRKWARGRLACSFGLVPADSAAVWLSLRSREVSSDSGGVRSAVCPVEPGWDQVAPPLSCSWERPPEPVSWLSTHYRLCLRSCVPRPADLLSLRALLGLSGKGCLSPHSHTPAATPSFPGQ